MKTIYSISKNAVTLDDGNFILTYGIEAKNEETDEIISKFNDVSVSRSITERIISLLNSCEVEIFHFHDIIIDELNR